VLEISDYSSNSDFAAILHAANSTSIDPQNILIWRNSDQEPSFVPICSHHYEPLQYPVLFPHGSSGWGLLHQSDLTSPDLMQRLWYKNRLLTDDHFLAFGHLTSVYLCNMYSRIKEECLLYIKHNRLSPALSQNVETPHDITLPASFLGSRKWASEHTGDSLAIARKYGQPSLFITMTCNPEWPEIQCHLRPGQKTTDIPVVVIRAFHKHLKRLLNVLRNKFGHLIYMIKVIGFQKRGLPHVHIIVKVRIVCSFLTLFF
jgi:hypothetical protein